MATWNILQLDAYPEKDNEVDVVFQIHWDCTETEGDYSGRVYGSVGLTLDAGAGPKAGVLLCSGRSVVTP